MATASLTSVLAALRKREEPVASPPASGPWQRVLWENVAYLAEDEGRTEAFEALRRATDFDPIRILDADEAMLMASTSHGIMAGQRAEKLRQCAQLAVDKFEGNVDAVLNLPPAKALAALKKFPGIGTPGAEKILMFEHRLPLLALDSNGLRVLLRLGFGKEHKDYAGSYRSVRDSLGGQMPKGFDQLIEAHGLLRRHGKQTCTNKDPDCPSCPLSRMCPSAT
jgi:endonuclease-3